MTKIKAITQLAEAVRKFKQASQTCSILEITAEAYAVAVSDYYSAERNLFSALADYDNIATNEKIKDNNQVQTVPLEDFLRLYNAAHAVIDQIAMHVDHAEYTGGMNAIDDFRDIACVLGAKYVDKEDDI